MEIGATIEQVRGSASASGGSVRGNAALEAEENRYRTMWGEIKGLQKLLLAHITPTVLVVTAPAAPPAAAPSMVIVQSPQPATPTMTVILIIY